MKKPLILALLALATAFTFSAHATFSIILQAGDLKGNANGSAPLPTGELLLLVATGADGVFYNNLTPGEYVAGDNVIVAAFGSNNNDNSAIATFNSLANLTGVQGQDLELRWFSQTTFASYNPSSPNTFAGEAYGEYAGPTAGTPNDGSPWVVPPDGTSSYALNFVTQSFNASSSAGLSDAEPNSDGYATMTVAVPEPASASLMAGALALGAMLLRRRR